LFLIERTGPSDIGDQVEFWCRLPAGNQIEEDRCLFNSPNGTTLFTKPGKGNQVYEDGKPNVPIAGLEAMSPGTDNNICGMTIKTMTEKYFGQWNCIFNPGFDDHQEYRGDFTLLTKEEMFVKDVRLPNHVVPVHYDLHLTPFIEEGNFTTSGTVILNFTVVPDNESNQVTSKKFKLFPRENICKFLQSLPYLNARISVFQSIPVKHNNLK
jgi:hypothetical protein